MGPKCKSSKTGESIRKNGRKEGMQEEREGKEKKKKKITDSSFSPNDDEQTCFHLFFSQEI